MSSVMAETMTRHARPTSPGVVAELFGRLQAEGLPYCHWKGNARLYAALSGERDIDLLVDREDATSVGSILAASGFKRFAAIPARASSSTEDHLAFDAVSGELLHVHLHYEMLLTKAGLHWYRLPWEKTVLSTRVFRADVGAHVADPHVELVIFAVRAALRLGAADATHGTRPAFHGAALEELEWLLARTSPERVFEVALPLVGRVAARLLTEMAFGGSPRVRDLLALRRRAKPSMRQYRVHGTARAIGRQLAVRWRWRWQKMATRYFAGAVPVTRTLQPAGRAVAFLGADGSGKSTVTAEVRRWLSRKIDVLPLYFGSGSGPVSLMRLPLRLLDALRMPGASRAAMAPADAPPVAGDRPRTPRATGVAIEMLRAARRGWWAVALAREKCVRLTQLRRARARGMVVICDRFPQDQILGYNDGPLLAEWRAHPSMLRRWAARRELAAYRTAVAFPPDLVVKLHVSPEVAQRRKSSTPMEAIRRKVDAVEALEFPPHVRVVEIDADQPAESVLLEAKRAVWEIISGETSLTGVHDRSDECCPPPFGRTESSNDGARGNATRGSFGDV